MNDKSTSLDKVIKEHIDLFKSIAETLKGVGADSTITHYLFQNHVRLAVFGATWEDKSAYVWGLDTDDIHADTAAVLLNEIAGRTCKLVKDISEYTRPNNVFKVLKPEFGLLCWG